MCQGEKYFELNFESKDHISKISKYIKKEYINRLFKVIVWVIALLIVYITFYSFSYHFKNIEIRAVLNQSVAIIIAFAFLLIHFFQLTSLKFAPSIVNFLSRELENIGFEFQRKYKMKLDFLLFNIFTICVFILINLVVNFSTGYFISSFIVRFIIIFILSVTIFPIFRGIFHDKFIVKLKNYYFVQINLQFRLMKHIEAEAHMVRIYMISNKLGSKSNQSENNLYKKISEKRWLPKKSKDIFPFFQLNRTLYFKDYTTPINFKEHFLNIVSAIREWDIEKINLYGKSRES